MYITIHIYCSFVLLTIHHVHVCVDTVRWVELSLGHRADTLWLWILGVA